MTRENKNLTFHPKNTPTKSSPLQSNMSSLSTSPSVKKVIKKIRKKVVDFVNMVAVAKKDFPSRNVGSFDWNIGTNMSNELFVDKTFKEVIDADKLNMALLHYGIDYFGKLEEIDVYGKKKKIKITSDDEQYALKTYHQFYTKYWII